MGSFADAILDDNRISEPKRLEAQAIAIFVQENISKEEINHSTWRFLAWELMTANHAAADKMNTSMARSELAGTVSLREGRFPMSELHKIFGIRVTRRKVDSLREFLKAMLEDELSSWIYQRWENDIQAVLLDLEKIDKSF